MPAPFTLGPVPYRPADYADWRSNILAQLAKRDPASSIFHTTNLAK